MKKILITGGTGLIGSRLTDMLKLKGYEVAHLSRSRSGNDKVPKYLWDADKKFLEPAAIDGIHSIIHLAGNGIVDKSWTKKRKQEILDSRIETLDLLIKKLGDIQSRPLSIISASGINFYGSDNSEKLLTEETKRGDDFISSVTRKWEQKAEEAEMLGIRVVKLRIGMVLSRNGGALEKIVPPFKLGLGAPFGNGKQYMSWIHLDDLCNLFIYAIENQDMKGSYNAVAPNPVTNNEFTKMLGKALKKPVLFPTVPSFALKMILGERAGLVLGSTRASNEKLLKTGFTFQFTTMRDSLEDIYS